MRPAKIHKNLLTLADKEARKSNVVRSKMSALALSANYRHVIADSHNIRIMNGKKWTLHAEERLLVKHRISFNTVLVYRANGCGTSKPCSRCARLLNEAGVSRVIYFDGKQWILINVDRLLTISA